MTSTLTRGLAAGAVGTSLLEATTYLDMVVTGRSASEAPGHTVVGLARRAGVDPPADASRVTAYGQLGGLAAGLGVGVAASVARRIGIRLPAPLAVVGTAAAAMAATDVPMAAAGVDDPRTWSATDWTRDLLPHLAYGLGVHWVLDRMPVATEPESGRRTEPGDTRQDEAGTGLLVRSAALGVAAGSRASLGVLTPALSGGGRGVHRLAAALTATELVADKLPQAPSRLDPRGQATRLAAGAVGATALARRSSRSPWLPAAVGALGAAVGTIAGAAWREAAADRGWTWQAGLAEDAAALALVALAVRRR